jgi:hypothetical protein
MLVRKMVEWVQDTLQDNKPPFSRWPERALVRWINFGQMTLAKYLPDVSARIDIVKMVPGAQQDFARVLAANIIGGTERRGIALMRVLRNMGVDGLTPGPAVRGAVDRYIKDALEPNWPNETANAVREIVFDKSLPTRCWISPGAPATPDLWLQIQWMAYLPEIAEGGLPGSEIYAPSGSSATELSITDEYAEDLHHYVVAMALLKGSKDFQNMNKSQYHAGLFMQSINMQAQVQTGQSPNLKVLPFLEEGA